MSCTVFAVPYALAWVAGTLITAAASGLNNEKQQSFETTNDCEDVHIITEKNFIEKSFETPFMDKEILKKTLEEHGVKNINEDGYGKISGVVDNYTLSFEKMEEDKPYFIKINCLVTDNAEEKVKDLESEYTLNVQEEAYLSIIDKLKENNMEIEEEEVQDDNTIVLTINID